MSAQTEDPILTGKIKWFNSTKGFGFIIPSGEGPEVFLHKTVCDRCSAKLPQDDRDATGMAVKYQQRKGEKGVQASWVEVLY
jgi:cold shock protein